MKTSNEIISMRSETDYVLSSCSVFPERPSSFSLVSYKPVLREINHLKGKIGEGQIKLLSRVLSPIADVSSKHKAHIGCCNFVEHEIEQEDSSHPHREEARCITPQKSEACRAEIELLLEYDLIETWNSPWASGVVLAKRRRTAEFL